MGELRTGGSGDAGAAGVSQDEMVDAAFGGDTAAKTKLERTARRRTAQNESGGGFASGERGVSGLGSAST